MAIDPTQPIHPGRYALALSQQRKAHGLSLNLAITFDPQAHPRDLHGQFRGVVKGLKVGESVKLPDGTTVKSLDSGYKVGDAKVTSAREAADLALNRSAKSDHPKSIGGTTSHPSAFSAMADAQANADAANVPAFQKGTPAKGGTGDNKPMRGTSKDGESGTVPKASLDIASLKKGDKIVSDRGGVWTINSPATDSGLSPGEKTISATDQHGNRRGLSEQEMTRFRVEGTASEVDDKTAFNAVTKAVDRMVEGGDDAFTGAADEIRDIHRAIKDPTFMQENGLDWEAETILDEIATGTEHSKNPDDQKLHAWATAKLDAMPDASAPASQPDKSASKTPVEKGADQKGTFKVGQTPEGLPKGWEYNGGDDTYHEILAPDGMAWALSKNGDKWEFSELDMDGIPVDTFEGATPPEAFKAANVGDPATDNPIPHVAPDGGDTGRPTPQGVAHTLNGELDPLNEQIANGDSPAGYMNASDAFFDAFDQALEAMDGMDANVEVIYGMGAIVDGKPIALSPVGNGDGQEAKVLEGGEAKAWLEDALAEVSAQMSDLDHGPVDGGARNTFEAQQSVIQKALKKLK